MKSCGSCTLCCKTMGVEDMPGGPKPPHKWCPACLVGEGCSIYESRPQTCRDFACVWLQDTEGLMDDSYRPDRIGVVFQPTDDRTGLVAHCDPSRPTAWRAEKPLALLRACAKAGYPATARAGKRYWVITGTTEWEVPPKFVIHGAGGKVDVRVPADVRVRIGLHVRHQPTLAGENA